MQLKRGDKLQKVLDKQTFPYSFIRDNTDVILCLVIQVQLPGE